MALSEDCIDYRERQQLRTQRWMLWGVLGAIGFHAGMIPVWRWLPLDAAQLTTEDRIQLTVMPPPPEAIADQAALADAVALTPTAPTDIAAPLPSSQSSALPSSAVAVAPARPPSAIADTVPPAGDPVAATADEEAISEPESTDIPEPTVEEPEIAASPELAENISEPEIEEPEIEESEIEESEIDESNNAAADALAADAEPAADEPELDSTVTDQAVDQVAPEIASAPDVGATAIDEVASAALPGHGSTIESSATSFAAALSRLLGNGNTPAAEAEPSGDNNVTASNAAAPNDIARSTGPDGPAYPGAGATGDEAAPGNSGNGSRVVSCRRCNLPAYPAAAEAAGIEGQPIVRAQFDSNGNVIGVTLERPSGNAELDQAALSAVRNFQFDAGGRSGSVPVEIPFVIEGSERHQEAQQQGDRDAATVHNDPPAAANSTNQPVQSAADTPASAPPAIDDTASDAERDNPVTNSSPAETDNALDRDTTAADGAKPEADADAVAEPEPIDDIPEPTPVSSPLEPDAPAVVPEATVPEAEPTASPEPVEDSE